MSVGGPGGGGGEVRYIRDVGPGDLGARVTLRRRLDDGRLGDLLGELVHWAGGVVRVRDRHGTEHAVAERDVVAVRRIPPPPPPRPRRR